MFFFFLSGWINGNRARYFLVNRHTIPTRQIQTSAISFLDAMVKWKAKRSKKIEKNKQSDLKYMK